LIRQFLCFISIPDKHLYGLSDGISLYWMFEQLMVFSVTLPIQNEHVTSYCVAHLHVFFLMHWLCQNQSECITPSMFTVETGKALRSESFDQMELASWTSFSI